MTDTPETDRLVARLEHARNFNVWWGPEAHLLTQEERAKTLNDALDCVDRGESVNRPPETGIKRFTVAEWLAGLRS